ncbi:3,4-dihydroxy 2-butanone 4-phosphate synthase / GTP cyclohydrolase II [Halolactibacillus halophilus]|uniref:Riboflavin biosynthesis protein RibBA n=1 Tax=Halolactibacillus halophilus TaxID=306540 RepID=A0A1I5QIH3_9BACI|nr:bifunctional 3,4-dihydroxy-2-butanone-4-phosphate synthase/GTP cyclohydrolase II [Halolactibacillus halophilus]GEM01814.1 riboflavin biosynthesis protein RibBA [Halolactibacillus halophilus]SFP46104.1 3,4-dihydroxy 2-butanone 4-phosphate synthase / GTP cyclohydrolase II [Halolactibacillus halophilus]
MHTIEQALEALKRGEVIIVIDDEYRENEGDFIALGEHATPEVINYMATKGKGLICTPIEKTLADRLLLTEMVSRNTDDHGTNFSISIDHIGTHTGISAFERSQTILALLEESSTPVDFKRPGHVFPLIADPDGVVKRPGHTEAAIDLAKLAGAKPVGVICEIMREDGQMMRTSELKAFAEAESLVMITIEQLVEYRKRHDRLVTREANIQLPTLRGDFKMVGYVETVTGKEHVALIKGDLTKDEAPLVRVHSECLTGDVFGSKRCDCGPQLERALETIEERGVGAVIYMRQEGRGIGLINKLKAYELQEQGYDTVEANHQLGFGADLRDYSIAAQILKDLGLETITLMTNNPRKLEGLTRYGININKRQAIEIAANENNADYLKTKSTKLGHLLNNQ